MPSTFQKAGLMDEDKHSTLIELVEPHTAPFSVVAEMCVDWREEAVSEGNWRNLAVGKSGWCLGLRRMRRADNAGALKVCKMPDTKHALPHTVGA